MMIVMMKMMIVLLIMMAMMMVTLMNMLIMMMMTFETLAGKLVPLGPVLQIPWHAFGQVGRSPRKLLADHHENLFWLSMCNCLIL